MRSLACACLLLVLSVPACSSATEAATSQPSNIGLSDGETPDGEAPDGKAPDNEAADSQAPDSARPDDSPCPAAVPAQAAACAEPGLRCTWGDDPRFGCREEAECTGTAWQVTQPSCPSSAACPQDTPTPADAGDAVCTPAQLGLTCVYAGAAYTCAPCTGSLCHPQNLWQTRTLAAGCPATLPDLGEPCASESLSCDYNACADDQPVPWVLGAAMTCTQGFWTAPARTVCM